jgi:adenosylcobinamide-phosphate synthase
MLGYKSDRYRLFGRAAARLDDVANFVPARLTALLMVVVGGSPRALRFLFRYGHRHTSPNAGYPEAALAGILDLRFGGPATYHGRVHKKPWIGERSRVVSQKDLLRACAINQRSTLVMVVLVVTVLLLQGGVLLP